MRLNQDEIVSRAGSVTQGASKHTIPKGTPIVDISDENRYDGLVVADFGFEYAYKLYGSSAVQPPTRKAKWIIPKNHIDYEN